MTEKQYRKADSMVFPTVMVVVVGILLNMLGMISSGGANAGMQIVAIVSAIGAIVTVVSYKKFQGTRKCGIYMSVAAGVVCLAMIILVDAQFFYMLVAALFIVQMAYLEKGRIIVSAVITVPVFAIKSLILSSSGAVSMTEAGTSIVMLILIVVSVYNITRIWIAFNSENMDTVRNVSKELVTHFDEANIYIKTLDEALSTSNLSMLDIAANVESTAHEIQRQSQMCVDIEGNTQNAKVQTNTMVQASGKTLEEVAQGVEVIDKLHNHAQDVARENKETVENVAALNERARSVKAILGTIDAISTQTFLLAMNASIEAARAGEAGKGFEVVAEEIRALSEQTKTATEDIETILTELNGDVERVTTSVNHSVEIVEEQNDLIAVTKSKFDAIESGVNELIAVINSFKDAVDDITNAAIVIADGATELSANTEEVAAASNDGTRVMNQAVIDMGQVKATLDDIYNLAQNLKNEYSV